MTPLRVWILAFLCVAPCSAQTSSAHNHRMRQRVIADAMRHGPYPDYISHPDPRIAARERALEAARERRFKRLHRSLVAAKRVPADQKR